MDTVIFHIDVNSAFLSWEATRRVQRGQEDIRLVPAIIGGDPKRRGSIVAAKSIPAKKYGIETGESVSSALRKCPGLIVAPGDFELYRECSHAFKSICKEYTPTMESFSIDEVFLDMSGMRFIYPDIIKTAYEIKDRIKEELGFTVNVGIGANKLCAKMASDFEKPDKVHTLFPDEIEEKMWPLPVNDLLFCGKSSAARLKEYGIKTIGELAKTSIDDLNAIVGNKASLYLKNASNGIDDGAVSDEYADAKGYSIDNTVEEDLCDLERINRMLLNEADVLSFRMRADGAKCKCVGVNMRTIDFKNSSHQKSLEESTNVTEEIYETAKELIRELWKGERLRLIGLNLTQIDRGEFEQINLFADEKKEKLKKLDSALDSIRGKYGKQVIKRASTMGDEFR